MAVFHGRAVCFALYQIAFSLLVSIVSVSLSVFLKCKTAVSCAGYTYLPACFELTVGCFDVFDLRNKAILYSRLENQSF